MAKSRSRNQRAVLSEQIVDTLLGYIRSHWYREMPAEAFAKDRPRLLEWVVFEAAKRLDAAGVSLPGERYLEIHLGMMRDAVNFGSRAAYIPAYLRHVVQSHWKIHWEEHYEEAKRLTPRIEEAVRDLAAGVGRRPDPVREMAKAADLLGRTRRATSQARAGAAADTRRQMDLF